ncbi:helix-turn-helix domain-containing protein [Providencia rettgeri]
MKIGTRIREIRKSKGMTILQLATAINSDVGNISRLERNQQGFSEAMLSKIATALDVTIADLFTEQDKWESTRQAERLDIDLNNGKKLRKDEIELLKIYNDLPLDEARHFLEEMKAKKSHYDAIFEEMLRKRGLNETK